ncbi:MAG: helix-turn-helix transcriptional regulator [Candidatus Gracilibacteria bacterium]|nr:helix-turn-helix transcriptional regulator [Candidatus Gracilibacteria bacterium]
MQDLTKWTSECKVYNLFDVLGKKWTIFIIYLIENGYNSFNSILRILTKLNPKVLSERLTQLSDSGIVKFDIDKKNGRTTYILTEKGKLISLQIGKISDIAYNENIK